MRTFVLNIYVRIVLAKRIGSIASRNGLKIEIKIINILNYKMEFFRCCFCFGFSVSHSFLSIFQRAVRFAFCSSQLFPLRVHLLLLFCWFHMCLFHCQLFFAAILFDLVFFVFFFSNWREIVDLCFSTIRCAFAIVFDFECTQFVLGSVLIVVVVPLCHGVWGDKYLK